MALDNTYQPPKNIPLRPLNKGMVRNLPPNGLPDGAFLRLQNYRVKEFGIQRRGGFTPFNKNVGTTEETSFNERLLDQIYFWSSANNPEMLLLGEKHLMQIDSDGSIQKVYANSTGEFNITSVSAFDDGTKTISVTVTATTEQAARYDQGVDIFFKDSDNGLTYFIGEVVSNSYSGTDLTLIIAATGEIEPNPYPAVGDTLYIKERFYSLGKQTVSYVVLPPSTYGETGKVIIADQGAKGLYQYANSTLSSFTTESSVNGVSTETQYLDSASVLTYFEDRLWVGNTVEEGTKFPQRIRWSDPVNFSRFQPVNYIDLPYNSGPLIRLLPLGQLLVAYFTDAIYIGRPTNIAGKPYLFEKIETGNMGLINQRALVAVNDSHYFVGTDDIYVLDMSQGIKPIGITVLDETLKQTLDYGAGLEDYIQIEHDPETETVVFQFPDIVNEGLEIKSLSTKLWRYNYKVQAWSYDEVYFKDSNKNNPLYYFTGLLPSRFYTDGDSWEDWIGTYTNPENDTGDTAWLPEDTAVQKSFYEVGSWIQLKDETLVSKYLYIPVYDNESQKQVILVESDVEFDDLGQANFNEDPVTYPVWSIAESGDFDFGEPDGKKTVTRLSLKIFDNQMREFNNLDKIALENLSFTIYTSDRQGYQWKRPTVFRFKRNYNEGYASFRTTGSTFRFKVVNSQKVVPFKISEVILRVMKRGLQIKN